MTRLTSRDGYWALLLLIAVLGQYILTVWTRDYGADAAVLSHVSFAGTIVSIVLAVTAILYSYYQGFAQQRDSAALATQIEVLRQVATDMRSSEATLSQGLLRIEDIRSKLDRSLILAEDTRTRIQTVEGSLESLKSRATAIDVSPTPAVPVPPIHEVAERLIASAGSVQLGLYLALQMGIDRGLTIRQIASKIVIPIVLSRANPNVAGPLSDWFDGILVGHVYVLNDLGLLIFQGSRVTDVNPRFRESLLDRVAKVPHAGPEGLIDIASVEAHYALLGASQSSGAA